MNVSLALKSVSLNLRTPEIAERQVVSIVCNLISRYNKLETEEAYTTILGSIPGAVQAWQEGKTFNLSSAIYRHGRFALLNAITALRRKERIEEKENTFSLDAVTEDGPNFHETIADPNSTSIDWGNAFQYILGNAGFTEREMKVFLGMRDGKTLEDIGNDFGVTRQAIHLSKKAIESKVMKIKHKVV